MADPQSRRHSLLTRFRWSPWIVIFVGLLTTSVFFFEVRKTSFNAFRARFEVQAADRAGTVVQEMDEAMLVARSLGRFCQEGALTQQEFSALAADLLAQHRRLGSLAWVPAVPGRERKSLEQTARRQGATGFHISENGPDGLKVSSARKTYYPLLCYRAQLGLQRVTGFDLGSSPTMLAALERARDTGEAAVVDGRKGIEGLDDQSGLYVLLPVYLKKQLSSTEDRRRALLGFVLTQLRTDEMLSAYLTTVRPEDFRVELLDPAAGKGQEQVQEWSGKTGRQSPSWRQRLFPDFPPYMLKFFSAKEWGLRISPGPGYMEEYYNLAYWLLLPAGLVITLLGALLVLYLRAVLTQREWMEEVVLERTAELREHKEHLERLISERTESLSWKSAFLEALTNTSIDGILVIDNEGKRIFQNQRAVDLWGVPPEAVDIENEEAWKRHVLHVVKQPDRFHEAVMYMYDNPDEDIHDEVELVDGAVLERYSYPVIGKDGRRYGRVLRFRDITDRKQAEEALKRSEATLRSVFSASPVGISLVDGDRMTSWTNEGMTAITGYSPEEAKELGLRAVYVSDEEFSRVHDHVYGEIKKGRVGKADTKWLHKDGSVLDVHLSAAAIDPKDLSAGVVFTTVDMTERKRAEEALRESEERYRIAIENSNDGISLAKDGRNEFVNRRFVEIFGYERVEDAIGDRSIAIAHPDDRQRVREIARKRRTGHRAPERYEFKGIKRNGEAIEIEVTVSPVLYRGETAFLVYFHDITERKRAEEALRESENKFRDLAEKAIVGVYLIQDGVFKYVNSRFGEIHGYAPEELIDRMGVDETVVADDVDGVRENIRKRMSGEIDLVRDEFRIVTKQGEKKYVEIYGTHTVYQGRKAIIGTLLDVTERKQTEASLRWKTAFLEAQVNSSLDGILVIDDGGRHILQNQRTADMWKIPREIIGCEDDTQQFSHIIGMAKQAQQFRRKVDHLTRHPDETSRDEIELIDGTVLDTYSCPVLGEDGCYYGRIWTFRDITELRRYWDMLENLSATDGLTDLPNRRRFDDFLNREWRRSMRDRNLISLILLDIDFFKEFNDHYGHLAGDDCLRQIAKVMREVVQRPGDLAARYGGEEFACILPDTNGAGAVNLANRIRDKVNSSAIPHSFSSVADHVTLSFGVATLVPSKGESSSDLIELADKLLYAAKQNGRDRIMSWRQPARERRVNER